MNLLSSSLIEVSELGWSSSRLSEASCFGGRAAVAVEQTCTSDQHGSWTMFTLQQLKGHNLNLSNFWRIHLPDKMACGFCSTCELMCQTPYARSLCSIKYHRDISRANKRTLDFRPFLSENAPVLLFAGECKPHRLSWPSQAQPAGDEQALHQQYTMQLKFETLCFDRVACSIQLGVTESWDLSSKTSVWGKCGKATQRHIR